MNHPNSYLHKSVNTLTAEIRKEINVLTYRWIEARSLQAQLVHV
jgi:hypothetical protein